MNIDRADKLWDRARKLDNDRFHFWLCYVYGAVKIYIPEKTLDMIEKDLEKQEKYDTGQ